MEVGGLGTPIAALAKSLGLPMTYSQATAGTDKVTELDASDSSDWITVSYPKRHLRPPTRPIFRAPSDASFKINPDLCDQPNYQGRQEDYRNCSVYASDALANGALTMIHPERVLAKYRDKNDPAWWGHELPTMQQFVEMHNLRLPLHSKYRALQQVRGYKIEPCYKNILAVSTDIKFREKPVLVTSLFQSKERVVDRFAVLARGHFFVISFNAGAWKRVDSRSFRQPKIEINKRHQHNANDATLALLSEIQEEKNAWIAVPHKC